MARSGSEGSDSLAHIIKTVLLLDDLVHGALHLPQKVSRQFFIMRSSGTVMSRALCAGALFASGSFAQSGGPQRELQYGENWVPTVKDSDLVAANFPDVNITLHAPAFMDPSTVPERFANGTEGPTDDMDLGEKYSPLIITNKHFH
jgi:hypothetical protein